MHYWAHILGYYCLLGWRWTLREPPLLRTRVLGEKNLWQTGMWQDSTLFSPPGNRAIFSTFWGDLLSELDRKTWRKRKQIHWRKFKRSGETSLKSQISVPCRGRTCPDCLQCWFPNFFYKVLQFLHLLGEAGAAESYNFLAKSLSAPRRPCLTNTCNVIFGRLVPDNISCNWNKLFWLERKA